MPEQVCGIGTDVFSAKEVHATKLPVLVTDYKHPRTVIS